jgi:hypothetical protein
MASSDEYKRQQDLLFQQIEEKAMMALQARDARIADVLQGLRKEIVVIAKAAGISPEEYRGRLENGLRELDLDQTGPTPSRAGKS